MEGTLGTISFEGRGWPLHGPRERRHSNQTGQGHFITLPEMGRFTA